MELKSIKKLDNSHIRLGFNHESVGIKIDIMTDGEDFSGSVTVVDQYISCDRFTPWDVLRRMMEDSDEYDQDNDRLLVVDSLFKKFKVDAIFTLIDRIGVVADAAYKYYSTGEEDRDILRDFYWKYLSKTTLEFTY